MNYIQVAQLGQQPPGVSYVTQQGTVEGSPSAHRKELIRVPLGEDTTGNPHMRGSMAGNVTQERSTASQERAARPSSYIPSLSSLPGQPTETSPQALCTPPQVGGVPVRVGNGGGGASYGVGNSGFRLGSFHNFK